MFERIPDSRTILLLLVVLIGSNGLTYCPLQIQ